MTAGGHAGQLGYHLTLALKNGVTEEELIEAITHVAFYAGWPTSMGAMTIAHEVFTTQKEQP